MAGEGRYEIGVSSAELEYYIVRVKELEQEIEELRARAETNEKLFREYEQVRLVVFQLTTEFRGSKAKIQLDEEKKRQKITILTNPRYKELQSLRKRFYYHLHRVAYRTRAGWVVFDSLPTDKLEKVIARINEAVKEVTGEREAVTILETLMPKSFLAGELKKYIAELRDKAKRLGEHLEHLREANEEDSEKFRKAKEERELMLQLLTIAEEELARYSI